MKDIIEHLEASGLHPVMIDENTVFPSAQPSNFLPSTNIQYAWDSTTLGALKTCPRLYQYLYVEGWSSAEESVHLRFGIEYHQALHDFELAKAKGTEHNAAVLYTIDLLTGRLVDYPTIDPTSKPSIRNKTRANLLRTVIWYLDKFRDDPAETVILEGGVPALEVSFKFELDWGPEAGTKWKYEFSHKPDEAYESRVYAKQPYLLCGHLDRIVTFSNETFVMDRKTTTSSLSDYYFAQFEPNNQMTLYTIAGKVVLGTTIRGVIIDAASVLVTESKFQRAFTYRSEDYLQEWLKNLKVLLQQAEQYAVEGYWPQNDSACSMYGGCKFREICSKSPKVRENFLRGSFVKLSPGKRWNPLVPRG